MITIVNPDPFFSAFQGNCTGMVILVHFFVRSVDTDCGFHYIYYCNGGCKCAFPSFDIRFDMPQSVQPIIGATTTAVSQTQMMTNCRIGTHFDGIVPWTLEGIYQVLRAGSAYQADGLFGSGDKL